MRGLAVVLALLFAPLLMVPAAFAQADRGYGGPSTVGPNFSTGKQSAPPDYGSSGKTKSYDKAPPAKKAAKPAPQPAKTVRKPPAKTPSKTKDVAKATPVTKESGSSPADGKAQEAEAESDTSAGAEDTAKATTPGSAQSSDGESATAADAPKSCRRFDATTSTTIEVACD